MAHDKLISVLKMSVAESEEAIAHANSADDFHYKTGMYSSITFIYLVYIEGLQPEIAQAAIFNVIEKYKSRMFTKP
jgi:hypothetical protein